MYMFDLFDVFVLFFFKQKTAYEMRISDWSSDVCSSDLQQAQREAVRRNQQRGQDGEHRRQGLPRVRRAGQLESTAALPRRGQHRRLQRAGRGREIGRASGRERVWQYV